VEDEELEREGGGGVEEESEIRLFFGSVVTAVFRGGERSGGGRVSYHGPPADCERSWRTVNGTRLDLISP